MVFSDSPPKFRRSSFFPAAAPLMLACGLAAVAGASAASAQLVPFDLQCESMTNPVGVGTTQPRLTWALAPASPAQKGQTQAAAQVEVFGAKGVLWDSGRVATGEQAIIVPEKLASQWRDGSTYQWRVRVWDADGKVAVNKEPAQWTTAILDAKLWDSAQWIGQEQPVDMNDKESGPTKQTHWFRKTLQVPSGSKDVAVHIASFGYHELYINGQRADDTVLNPAVSRLTNHVFSRTYRIPAKLLNSGKNTVAVWLGQGWAGWGNWNSYGTNLGTPIKHGPAFKAVITGIGGTPAVSDTSWKTKPAPLAQFSQWMWAGFGGETLDLSAMPAKAAWNAPAFDDSAWSAAKVLGSPENVAITAQSVQPNRIVKEFPAVSVEALKGATDSWVVDFGQDYAGWVRLPLRAPAGTKVKLHYSERYDPKNPTRYKNEYNQIDHVTLSGDPKRDVFENRFNYHQFRWLVIEGLAKKPELSGIRGLKIRTDFTPATTFESSDPQLNKLHALTIHTYECLTLGGYIVDCSHRERCGYGAEGQASMDTGMSHFDSAALLRKMTGDWRDVMSPEGHLPNTAPTYWGGGGPAWKMAVVNIPYAAYLRYGDRRVLEENYSAMRLHLDLLEKTVTGNAEKLYLYPGTGGNVWNDIGDWYPATRIDPPKNGSQKLSERLAKNRQFFNNCFLILTLENGAATARVLGKTEDAARYAALADAMRPALHAKFFDATEISYNRIDQTNLALALIARVPPPTLHDTVAAALEKNIRETQSGHISSGVLGTWLQLKLLTATGRSDLVHLMATTPGLPGWAYFMTQGHTAIPETWDTEKAPAYGRSLAHSSYISIGTWFIEGLAGIRPDPSAAGFSKIILAPGATDKVDWVKATHRTPRGEIRVHWRRNKASGKFILDATLPPNTETTLHLPGSKTPQKLPGGTYHFEVPLAK